LEGRGWEGRALWAGQYRGRWRNLSKIIERVFF